MENLNLRIDPSWTAATVALLATASVIIWWLIRKRQKRVWLPTVRVMDLESRILPRLMLQTPPLIPFLCFAALAALMIFFALKPRAQIFTPFEPKQKRVHLFVDLSPSNSAHQRIEDYAEKLVKMTAALGPIGRFTFSTSHSPEIFEFTSSDALRTKILEVGYHRSGIKLGPAVKLMLDRLGEVDRLIVAADRDQHSWNGFYWRYLLDDMNVTWLDITDHASGLANIYFGEPRFLSAPSAQTMDWEVEIARNTLVEAVGGQLLALYEGRELARTPWKIAAGKARTSARLSWPAQTMAQAHGRSASNLPNDASLIFRLEPDGADRLGADNDLRTLVLGLKQNILLIADPNGERPLEDPAKQLTISLEIHGFRIMRRDFLDGDGPNPAAYPLWIILGGVGSGVDRFCPKSLHKSRLLAKDSDKSSVPKVWLAPHTLEADYGELCQCYARLIKGVDSDIPAYCQHVTSRSQWLALLPSLGAKQIGGEIGDASAALAFRGRDDASQLEVIAFTVPLMPLPGTTFNYAQFPLMIHNLLQWQGYLPESNQNPLAAWPRIDDATQTLWLSTQTGQTDLRWQQSNVPIAESLLSEMDDAELPPRWNAQYESADHGTPLKQDREDPLPWLKIAAVLVSGLIALEAISIVFGLRKLRPNRKVLLSLWLVGALSHLMSAEPAEASVGLGLLGYGQANLNFDGLAREVAQRTSIELQTKPLVFTRLSEDALSQPWLWVHSLTSIVGSDGALVSDVLIWLRRGGLLILESPLPETQLNQLASRLLPEAAAAGAAFQPLPPDHELLRSFYLLDALPPCNGQIWRALRWDGRLAVLVIPYGFLDSLKDGGVPAVCPNAPDYERSIRIFINLVMVALATDYKKDQIHLPEILKRLR